jgi:hypothetical protein
LKAQQVTTVAGLLRSHNSDAIPLTYPRPYKLNVAHFQSRAGIAAGNLFCTADKSRLKIV